VDATGDALRDLASTIILWNVHWQE
jgi:hypothetical protein